MRRLAQHHAKRRHRRRKLEVLARLRPRRTPIHQREFQSPALLSGRFLVAHLHAQQLRRPAGRDGAARRPLVFQRLHARPAQRRRVALAHGHHLVERRHRVPGAHVAGIDLVVGEIFLPQQPVLVADQPVRRHARRVELHLHLHVLGHRHQRAAGLLDEQPPRLRRRIHVAVVSVALVGQFFERAVLVVAHAEAEHGEKRAALGLFLDQPHQLALARRADVEIAIRAQNHAVHAARHEIGLGDIVGELDAHRTIGRAARRQPIERTEDLARPRNRCRGQRQPRGAGVRDDRHAVIGPQPVHQHLHRLLHQRQLVRVLHRAGDIQQEHQIRARSRRLGDFARLQPYAHQPVRRRPRRLRHLQMRGHRHVFSGRSRVTVREVIDQLLHAHRIARRTLALVEETPHVGVARRVHIDAKRR